MTRLDLVLPAEILRYVHQLILDARRQTVAAVNLGLTVLYWSIGRRPSVNVLRGERAAYGEQIVATLSRELLPEFGWGSTERSLRRKIQFAHPRDSIPRLILWASNGSLKRGSNRCRKCLVNPFDPVDHVPEVSLLNVSSVSAPLIPS